MGNPAERTTRAPRGTARRDGDRRPAGRPKGTGSQRIYDQLRDRILSMQITQGEDLDELALVEAFGLSRTPVREALIRLQSDGLVDIYPNRGARVAPIPFESIHELFEALDITSRAVSHFAALRHTPHDLDEARRCNREFALAAAAADFRRMGEANRDFHRALAAAAHNRFLADDMARLLSATMRFAYIAHSAAKRRGKGYKDYFARLVAEHDRMIAMIAAGDAAGSESLAGEHVRLFQQNVAKFMLHTDAGRIAIVSARAKGS